MRLTKSRVLAAFSIAADVLIVSLAAFLFDTLVGMSPKGIPDEWWYRGVLIVFVITTLIAGWDLIRRVRTARHGDVFEFDRSANRATRNGEPIGRMDEVSAIVLRLTGGSGDNQPFYKLYLQLIDDRKIHVVDLALDENVTDTAGDIAEFLGVAVKGG